MKINKEFGMVLVIFVFSVLALFHNVVYNNKQHEKIVALQKEVSVFLEEFKEIQENIDKNTNITQEYLRDRESVKRILDNHNEIFMRIIEEMNRRRI